MIIVLSWIVCILILCMHHALANKWNHAFHLAVFTNAVAMIYAILLGWEGSGLAVVSLIIILIYSRLTIT